MTNTINIVTVNTTSTMTPSERAFQEESLRRLRQRTFKKFEKKSAAQGMRDTFALLCKMGLAGN